MTITQAHDVPEQGGVIKLPPPSPWERAGRLADEGEVARLVDEEGHRYVVMSEARFQTLDALEDAQDILDAESARAEPSVPYERVREELGLS
ncbi:MAG: hypothetical protein DLM55_11895 [Acidimicrobiales bacterium]|nr:MAG: hypothetical protein DLM55_11895 [Acidimicrobiales bacterium]